MTDSSPSLPKFDGEILIANRNMHVVLGEGAHKAGGVERKIS